MRTRDITRQYMSIDMIRTGQRIQTQIQKAGFTQAKIAAYMDISNAAVSNWCQGRQLPTLDHLDELACLLDIPCSSLIVHYGDPVFFEGEMPGETGPASAPLCTR